MLGTTMLFTLQKPAPLVRKQQWPNLEKEGNTIAHDIILELCISCLCPAFYRLSPAIRWTMPVMPGDYEKYLNYLTLDVNHFVKSSISLGVFMGNVPGNNMGGTCASEST